MSLEVTGLTAEIDHLTNQRAAARRRGDMREFARLSRRIESLSRDLQMAQASSPAPVRKFDDIEEELKKRWPHANLEDIRRGTQYYRMDKADRDAFREEYAESIRAAMTGYVNPEILEQLTTVFPEEAANSLASQLSSAQLRAMGDTLGRWTDSGKRPRDAGKFLEQVTMLDINRARSYEKMAMYLEQLDISDADMERRLEDYYQKLVRDRRDVIAHTEGRRATSTARDMEARDRGSQWKRWITVGDERVGDDHAANEAEGTVPIDHIYDDGTDRPPGRPNCRCTIAYLTDTAKEIDDQMRGNKDPDQDKVHLPPAEPFEDLPPEAPPHRAAQDELDRLMPIDGPIEEIRRPSEMPMRMSEQIELLEDNFPGLSPEEIRGAIEEYTTGDYMGINQALQDGTNWDEQQENIELLRLFMDEGMVEPEENIHVYRGIGEHHPIHQAFQDGIPLEGLAYTEDGFSSYSCSRSTAAQFSPDRIIVDTVIPKGASAMQGQDAELEWIVRDGQQMFIESTEVVKMYSPMLDEEVEHLMVKTRFIDTSAEDRQKDWEREEQIVKPIGADPPPVIPFVGEIKEFPDTAAGRENLQVYYRDAKESQRGWLNYNDPSAYKEIVNYTGTGHIDINRYLRDPGAYPKSVGERLEKRVEKLRAAVHEERLQPKENIHVYRGLGEEHPIMQDMVDMGFDPEKMHRLVGMTYKEEGFTSCASSMDSALKYSYKEDVVVDFVMPEGTPATVGRMDEGEWIIEDGKQFLIDGVEVDDKGVTHIKVSMLDEKGRPYVPQPREKLEKLEQKIETPVAPPPAPEQDDTVYHTPQWALHSGIEEEYLEACRLAGKELNRAQYMQVDYSKMVPPTSQDVLDKYKETGDPAVFTPAYWKTETEASDWERLGLFNTEKKEKPRSKHVKAHWRGTQLDNEEKAKIMHDILSKVFPKNSVFLEGFGDRAAEIMDIRMDTEKYPEIWVYENMDRRPFQDDGELHFEKGKVLNMLRKVDDPYGGDLRKDWQAYAIVHEMAHALDRTTGYEITAKMKAFHERRTKGEKEQKLRDLFPQSNYKPEERVKKDDYFSPYCGKEYGGKGPLELFAMGVGRMYTDPEKFAEEDPEYFQEIWEVLYDPAGVAK